MKFNFDALMKVLPDAISGWINVFIVIAVIVIVVSVLNRVTSDKED